MLYYSKFSLWMLAKVVWVSTVAKESDSRKKVVFLLLEVLAVDTAGLGQESRRQSFSA